MQRLLDGAANAGCYPGAQSALSTASLELDWVTGVTALSPPAQPVDRTTRFDIASLTKAFCTSVLLMQAVDERRLSLDDTLATWVPELPAAESITIAMLASHRAGLAAHRPYFQTLLAEGATRPPKARRRFRELLSAEPLVAVPGQTTLYSDLGHILLGWVLEEVLADPLDALFTDRIAGPLGLTQVGFGPIAAPNVAATEVDETGRRLQGRVHDENARALGGVAGHAGLFSSALDAAALMRHLGGVRRGATGIVRSATLRAFWEPVAGSTFTLGWDTPSEPSSSGRLTTRGAAVGHLGFTGCSVWHDWRRQTSIVLLTNRVHPSRDNRAIHAFRPAFHDAIHKALSDTDP